MNILDIILILFLLWALYDGFKEGIVVQLGGLAGLFIGIYLAFRYGATIGNWLGIDDQWATLAGFVIVMVAVIVGIALLSRALRGVCRFAGLSVLDKIGGIVVSLLKTALLLGLLLYCFNWVNQRTGWVAQEKVNRSKLYHPLINIAEKAFPYIDFVKEKLLSGGE